MLLHVRAASPLKQGLRPKDFKYSYCLYVAGPSGKSIKTRIKTGSKYDLIEIKIFICPSGKSIKTRIKTKLERYSYCLYVAGPSGKSIKTRIKTFWSPFGETK